MSALDLERMPRVFGDIALIPLSQGYHATVDAADLHLVEGHRWYAVKDRAKIYAYTNIRRPGARASTAKMHRLILEVGREYQVDHRDGDGLNNRRANLRAATNAQNAWNAGRPVHNTSGYKGVYWHRKNRKWIARIAVNRRLIMLGSFAEAEEAHRAFCEAAEQYHGEFARFA